MSPVIYLDNNATTAVDPLVLEAMLPYLQAFYGNPSSMHSFGGQVGRALTQAREQVAALLGSDPTEILFTSCGSEGNNTAIRAALAAQPDKRHIITTQVEHASVLNLCKHLEKQGYRVTYLSVDGQGCLDLLELEAALTGDTALVTFMAANNETGVLFPIEPVGSLAQDYGAIVHVDAVQAVGKIPLALHNLPVDLLTLSSHKLHAPKGIGALYIRRGFRFRPLLLGGHQERGRRAGTENVPGIVALGKAAELAQAYLGDPQERHLRDALEQGILQRIPDTQVNGHPSQRLPNTTNLGFKFVEGEAILFGLNKYGICASSGSACTSGSLEPSHVLRAMHLPYTVLHGSIRFSLSRFTQQADVDRVLEVLPEIIRHLRAISPFNSEAEGWLQQQERELALR
ncbi:cysteine desulfurase NifS [Synechococcus sp. Nb3U1]|uniref:cysteine desulfurase NifS n=1 Tax=Synechococcus sp. Nb3U1 TaxID=1914529 RepID=UPI001F315B20|nr:cysteine desulfurase NifS [Synechococcus sp. Nb3U1]MCF2970211.1 cysteine desulfurase NifS [Synechococcus sp. Nb3U1]